MKLRVIALTFAIVAMACGSAFAQDGGVIGIYNDIEGSSCVINATPYVPQNFYILAKPNVGVTMGGLTGAEFRIVGHPSPADAVINPTANANANVTIGAPFDTGGAPPQGINIAFPACQTPDAFGVVVLYTVQIVVLNAALADVEMEVMGRNPPSSPNFPCALVTSCDPPFFTAKCVNRGRAYLNHSSPGGCVVVSVEESTWTKVKNLYN